MQPPPLAERQASGIRILNKTREIVSANKGPTGFHWLVNGLLGGTRMPGGVTDLRVDLEALKLINASLLITLNDVWQPPVAELAAHGIESYTHKIPDMQAPELDHALATCQKVDSYLVQDRVCVFHCRAGKGRTGTMLAAQLVYYGSSAQEAIAAARTQNPEWIETKGQIRFLRSFDLALNKTVLLQSFDCGLREH